MRLTRANTFLLQENGGIDLIFHTNLFSGKTMDLTTHPKEVNMSFLDITTGAWASISGTASIIGDPGVVQKYYSPTLKAWLGDMGDGVHDGGPTDPRIGVIKLESKLATHVVARKGMLGRAVNTVKGAVKGDVPQVNSIRELSSEELAECESFLLDFVVAFTDRQQGAKRTSDKGSSIMRLMRLDTAYDYMRIVGNMMSTGILSSSAS